MDEYPLVSHHIDKRYRLLDDNAVVRLSRWSIRDSNPYFRHAKAASYHWTNTPFCFCPIPSSFHIFIPINDMKAMPIKPVMMKVMPTPLRAGGMCE